MLRTKQHQVHMDRDAPSTSACTSDFENDVALSNLRRATLAEDDISLVSFWPRTIQAMMQMTIFRLLTSE